MNYKMISRFLSLICLAEAVFMLPALVISIYDGEAKAILGFGATICIAIALYITLKLLSRNTANRLSAREGFVCPADGVRHFFQAGCGIMSLTAPPIIGMIRAKEAFVWTSCL